MHVHKKNYRNAEREESRILTSSLSDLSLVCCGFHSHSGHTDDCKNDALPPFLALSIRGLILQNQMIPGCCCPLRWAGIEQTISGA